VVADPAPTVVIDARGMGLVARLREFWRYRELLVFLAWRDIRVRYRQTLIGAAWAVVEPFVGMVVFTLLFSRVARFSSGEIPYPLYCYAALLLWNFFARALRESTICFTANAALLRKTYFPRLVLPCACVLSLVIDFCCALALFVVLCAYYGLRPGLAVLTVPLWLLLAGSTALGSGLILGAINLRYRDIGQTLPFIVQTWLLASPVAYPRSVIPASWLALYQLNPMVGIVEGMRWALLPQVPLDSGLAALGAAGALTLLAAGVVTFSHAERGLADVV
jgi:lipopolysaccharide transport system permease protein